MGDAVDLAMPVRCLHSESVWSSRLGSCAELSLTGRGHRKVAPFRVFYAGMFTGGDMGAADDEGIGVLHLLLRGCPLAVGNNGEAQRGG